MCFFRCQALNDPIAHAQRRSVKDVLLKIFYVWFFSCLVSSEFAAANSEPPDKMSALEGEGDMEKRI